MTRYFKSEMRLAISGLIMAEIDLALVADARQRIPTLRHTRSFAVETRRSEQPKLDAAE